MTLPLNQKGLSPFSEEARADADVGGAFLDGGGEVAGHAHGELAVGEGAAELFEFAETMKGMGADCSYGCGRRDAHESLEFEAGKMGEGFADFMGIDGEDAIFGWLLVDVDVEKDRESFGNVLILKTQPALRNFLRELDGVDGLDGAHEGEKLFYFVGLKMTDEMPADVFDAFV